MMLNFLKVFSIAVNILLTTAYGSGVVAGATLPFLPCKLVAVRIPLFCTRNLVLFICLLPNLIFVFNFYFFLQIIGHSALAALLWRKAQTIDLTDPPSMQSFYMFFYAHASILNHIQAGPIIYLHSDHLLFYEICSYTMPNSSLCTSYAENERTFHIPLRVFFFFGIFFPSFKLLCMEYCLLLCATLQQSLYVVLCCVLCCLLGKLQLRLCKFCNNYNNLLSCLS